MRKFLPSIISITLLAIFLSVPSIASIDDWIKPNALVRESLVEIAVPMEHDGVEFYQYRKMIFIDNAQDKKSRAICTGSVINAIKEYVLTANHCFGEKMVVDNKMAWPVFRDKEYDLMVLRVEQLNKPSIKPSTVRLIPGTPIAALGYGYGLNEPLLKTGAISSPFLVSDESVGSYLVFDGAYVPGMSGGPVFDSAGKVVGIVQLSDDRTGWGRDIKDILRLTWQYWE